MQEIIERLNSDLSLLLLNNNLDLTLYKILSLMINLFSYFSYLIIILFIFRLIIDMFIFVFNGGVRKWKDF